MCGSALYLATILSYISIPNGLVLLFLHLSILVHKENKIFHKLVRANAKKCVQTKCSSQARKGDR